jgi:hypothetical protein
MSKEFYRMSLSPTEDGLQIFTQAYISVHETECFCFCVLSQRLARFNSARAAGESVFKTAKARNIKLYRINKRFSRIAFATREKALENLRYRKSLQVRHLKRELSFANAFLRKTTEAGPYIEPCARGFFPEVSTISDTQDLVLEYLRFD